MTSPLRLLLKDGTKDAQIIDGKILAPGSKFDGLKATESNLTKALFSSGSKPTNIQDYVVTPNAGEQILPDGTPLPMTDPRYHLVQELAVLIQDQDIYHQQIKYFQMAHVCHL